MPEAFEPPIRIGPDDTDGLDVTSQPASRSIVWARFAA